MNLLSPRWLTSIASLVVLLTLSAFAQSADPPSSTVAASAEAPNQAPSPDNLRAAPSAADSVSEASREESAASVATTSSPNMIGDMGSGPTLHSVLPMPAHPGPVQTGSFLLPPTANKPAFNGSTGSFTTNATTVFGGSVPSTVFTFNNPGGDVLPASIPLTNADSVYLNAATQALTNYYKSQNTAYQQLSNVNVSPNGAVATEIPGPSRITAQFGDTYSIAQFYTYQYSIIPSYITINIPSPSGGVLGRQRVTDNENVLPTDRVFCDYSYFHDAALASPSDANRFVPGFEKTFFDQRMSVEMRFPMGVLESSDIVADSPTFGTTGQFGDIQVILKAIVLQADTWTLCMGLEISVPTAPGINVGLADGTPLVRIGNSSTHLLPFFGLLVTPNDDWFIQTYLQVDVPASGDPVSANLTGSGLVSTGEIYDQTQLFADAVVGRWLYRNPAGRLSGLAAVFEAHYTGGLNAPSAIQAGNFTIGNNSAEYNVLDLVVGAHAVVGNTTWTLGYATPVTEDRGFQGELRCFVNRKF